MEDRASKWSGPTQDEWAQWAGPLAVAQRLAPSRFVLPDRGTSAARALDELSHMTSQVWDLAGFLVLAQTSELDCVQWLHVARQLASESGQTLDPTAVKALQRQLEAELQRRRQRALAGDSNTVTFQGNRNSGGLRLCLACFTVRQEGEICKCHASENAGRFDN